MDGRQSPALKAISDAVLAVASELAVDEVLQRLVDSARELAGARYAALGIPDGDGGFPRRSRVPAARSPREAAGRAS